jgi:LmbE family N-acetylglucosaminyl deacetylase
MSGLDLLAFGPHPDDLEIGLGGTLAKHAALGHAVGLCDLTRGEMSSNGTPDERVREAEARRGARISRCQTARSGPRRSTRARSSN